VANTVTNKPAAFEKLMLQAAQLNPQAYYKLADYNADRNEQDKAAEYLEKASTADPDAVRVAHHAPWRVRYYLKKGQTDKAREIADEAGEVYSHVGLEAKGLFLEATTNYDGALEWYARIEERYHDSKPALNFCLRRMAFSSDQSYVEEVQKRIKTLFPRGLEKVTVKDFQGPPTDGVLIMAENDLIKTASLKKGDVIVAVYGVRVHHMGQYIYGRQLQQTPELELILWNGEGYRECRASPPNHRFGVEFGDYLPTTPKSAR
jgi:tetratricopeptide (TPR) repeat protein